MLKQLFVLAALLTLSACNLVPTGPTQHETRSIDLDKSESVRVQLNMGAGELEVGGGAQKLMDADFTYNVAGWKPDVRYRSSGSFGDLIVEQHGPTGTRGNATNRWNLRLNNGVMLDLRGRLGAGEARMDLGTLNLRSVELELGAGQINLDLRGTPKRDYSVRIRGGVGEATVYLPKDVGISATAKGGIGDISTTGLHRNGDNYTNDAFEKPGVRIRLDIQGGVGSIRLIAQ